MNRLHSGYDPPLPLKLNSPPSRDPVGFFDSGGLKTQGRTWGGARVVRRRRWLTTGGAPQLGYTPLHLAAREGHPEVVRALVEAGADVTAKSKVRERRVGGEGHRLRQSRDFGQWWQPSGGAQPPAWNERLFYGAAR